MSLKAIVTVALKPAVLDAQGKAVVNALHGLGFGNVDDARVGKVIELALTASDPIAAEAEVKEMCEKLLANTVIENYQIAISA